jgi:small GTP-binding protein
MGLLDRIKDIEKEMERTQKNKATEFHFGQMKARLAKLRSELLDPPKKTGDKGAGFDVEKHGHARVAMIGFPSVGKSTILSHFTETKSEICERDFTTLTCIPGTVYYNNCKIQLLDLPGIIEGASEGRGKGRQVIACAKSADLILIVLDAAKYKEQKEKILIELDLVGIRLNKVKPEILIKQTSGGGIQLMSPYKLTKCTHDDVRIVLHEYKILNAQVNFKDDYDIDDLIDTLEGNRRYIRGLFVYNKIDTVSMEDVDYLAKLKDSIVLSVTLNLGTEFFLEKLWEYLELVRVYTKKKGHQPDFSDPIVLRKGKGGFSVCAAIKQIHRELVLSTKSAIVWGKSVKYSPQKVGLDHILADEDVLQILKKT